MAAGQSSALPPHPFTGADVKVAARGSDVLAYVKNARSQAALRQLPLQSTERVVDAAPMDFPAGRVEDLDLQRGSSFSLVKEARLALRRHHDPFG
jgi:hypothetical protein